MKKEIYFLILPILFINLISASYACSNGTFTESMREIKLYETNFVNGIDLGLTFSLITSKMQAELILDARKFSLSNLANSTKFEIKNIGYNLTLYGIQNNKGTIGINGVSKSIENLNIESIQDFNVLIFNIRGVYPGEGSLEGLVGTKKISLSNEKAEIIKLNGINYLLELKSASPNSIIILVKKCSTGEIMEIREKINNSNFSNISNNTPNNASLNASIENTTIIKENITFIENKSLSGATNKTSKFPYNSLSKENFFLQIKNYLIIIPIVLVLLVIGFYLLHLHNKRISIIKST